MIQSSNYSSIRVIHARSDIHPPMLRLPKNVLCLLLGLYWFMVMIITYFRYVLYEYLFTQYKLKDLKPIDILTFLAAFIPHLHTVILVLYGTAMVINDSTIQYLLGGHWICPVLIYIIEFGRFYSFIGGFMIALYRILLIKHDR